MANQTSGNLIHCSSCGEDFAAAYRRCPFCGAKADRSASQADDYGEEPRPALRGGGRRLSGQASSNRDPSPFPWKPVLYVLAALVIIVAIWLLITKLLPMMPGFAAKPTATPSTPPTQSASVKPSTAPSPTVTPSTAPSEAPSQAPSPTPSVNPDPVVSTTASLKPSSDFTISKAWPDPVQLSVRGGTAVAWSSDNEAIATVSDKGLVTGVGKGTATITCTLSDGTVTRATVRVTYAPAASSQPEAPAIGSAAPSQAPSDTPSATPSSTPSAAPSSTPVAAKPKLSTTDFTLSEANGLSAYLTVSGGTAASWSSSNEAVVTVSPSGKVTAVGKGTATITCTLTDGTTLKATARVSK